MLTEWDHGYVIRLSKKFPLSACTQKEPRKCMSWCMLHSTHCVAAVLSDSQHCLHAKATTGHTVQPSVAICKGGATAPGPGMQLRWGALRWN